MASPSRSARRLGAAFLAAAAAVSAPARAHDLWIVPEPWAATSGRLLRLDLATGMEFPKSETALGPERIVRAWIRRPDGEGALPRPRVEGSVLRYEVTAGVPGLHRVVVETSPRFIRLGAREFEEYLREDGIPLAAEERRRLGETGAEGREFYAKYAQAFVRVVPPGPGPATQEPPCCAPLGLKIEIVPGMDPTRLRPGRELPVRVLYAGKPAVGLRVRARAAGDPQALQIATTDPEGRAAFVIDRPGGWALVAIHMERRQERSEADWDSHWASLTFSVP